MRCEGCIHHYYDIFDRAESCVHFGLYMPKNDFCPYKQRLDDDGEAVDIVPVVRRIEMPRLIDADALLAKKWDLCDAVDAIKSAPTIDAVPVVRCGECKWGRAWKNAFGIDGFKCDLLCVDLSPEAFCSYGERRKHD